MPRTVKQGTGVTERRMKAHDLKDSADAPLLRDALLSQRDSVAPGQQFNAATERAEADCHAILRAAPDDFQEDSPSDFARRILRDIRAAKNEARAGNADAAARLAFLAGVLWAQARMKWQWEAFALKGKDLTGRNTGKQSKTQRRRAFLTGIRQRLGGVSRDALAAAAWEEVGRMKEEERLFEDERRILNFANREKI